MDELKLTEFEQGYLTAFYHTDAHIQGEHSGRDEEMDWYGVQVGERMFDLCIWEDEETAEVICVVYECHQNNNGEWTTDTSKQWMGLN